MTNLFTCLSNWKLKHLCALLVFLCVGVGNAWGLDSETYTFNTKSWGATNSNSETANWTEVSDGNQFNSSQSPVGLQITTGTSGAHGTSPITFSGVSSVVITYNSTSKGVGSFTVQIGSNTALTPQAISKSQTNATLTFSPESPQTGKIKITGTCTTNSFSIVSVRINYSASDKKTLVYDANGALGSGPEDSNEYDVGEDAIVLGKGGLYKVGYTFSGWNTAANGTGDSYAEGSTFPIAASGNKLYAQWTNTYAGEEFTLVEDLSELSAGSKIIILDVDTATAISTTQADNNRTSVAASADGGFTTSTPKTTVTLKAATTVQVITLEDLDTPIDNTYQFNVEDGYLFAASSSSNYLRTQASNDANGYWQIALSSGTFSVVAQGSNTHNVMQKNTSSPFFSCYTSAGQKDVLIYVKDEGTKYTITWANGGHGTAPTYPTSAAKVTLPELSADGWQHTGWKANQAVTNVSTSASISAGTEITNGTRVQLGANTTFTAQWKQILAAPSFSPSAGTFNTTQTVELSCETVSGCSFRYTTDGSTPTSSSGTVYSGAISITQTTTIKAIAYKDGCVDSEVATAAFTLKCANLTFDVAAGTYTGAQSVEISTTTDGATIHYTTDGSAPTAESATYSSPLTVDCSQQIKAIAVKSGWSNSNQGSATYHIKYNVTWKVDKAEYKPGSGGGGGTNGSSSVECGYKVTQLPTDPDPAYNCGDRFMGWTTTANYSGNSAPGDLFTTAEDSPEITEDTTFHAVFADYAD